jgi:hypothetical protein
MVEIELIAYRIFWFPSIFARKYYFKYPSKLAHNIVASLFMRAWVLVTKAEHLFLSAVDIAGAFSLISLVGFNDFTAE